MEDAITRVVEASPSIRASEEAVRATGGGLLQAGARPNPELALEAANIGGSGAFSGFDRAEMTLSVGQTIEFGGKRDARIGLAVAEREMARLSASITLHDTVLAAREAYINVAIAAATVQNAEHRTEVARALEAAVNRRVQSARDSTAALDRVVARALEATADLNQARYALRLSKQHLSSLWGEMESHFEVDYEFLAQVESVDASTFQAQLGNVPDLLLAKAMETRTSAVLTLERAKGSQDPTLSLGVRQFQQSDDVAAVLSLSMPLGIFNTNLGNIESAEAQHRRSEFLSRDARLRFDRSLSTNLGALQAAHADVLAFRDGIIPRARTALSRTHAGYARGAFTYLEVLEAQQALQEFQAREISALKRFHMAHAALDRLMATYKEPLLAREIAE